MVRIAVGGAEGRMGRLIAELVQQDPEAELAARVTRPNATQGGWKDVANPVDIFIDFTHKDAVLEHVAICEQRKIPVVIGVTGLLETEQEIIRKAAAHIPILLSPNMSIGANLIFKLLEIAAKTLAQQFNESEKPIDVAITEIHHRHKKDAPSGTAKRMGEIIAKEFNNTVLPNGIQFSSLRLGEVMGDHRALFALQGEQLEITHQAMDRIIFAKGALLAAKWLRHKAPGLYSMQDILAL